MSNGRLTERHFSQQVVDLAQVGGWLVYRAWRSLHSPAGFPDLVLVETRPPFRLVFAELKVGGRIPTGAQRLWLDALAACAQGIGDRMIIRLWRPEDWDEIVTILIREKGE